MSSVLHWNIFCKVVDNFGDIGVCWRLCVDLAARGHTVRLWVDDASALAWMAPQGWPGVEVIECKDESTMAAICLADDRLSGGLGDVLVDTFGCDFAIYLIANKPTNTTAAAKNTPENRPIWLNLEYLTAESYAERAHTLPSPQHTGVAAGWTQRYFYPGFNSRTGGLLREKDLFERQKAFDKTTWLNQLLNRADVQDLSFLRRRESTAAVMDSRLRGNDGISGVLDVENTCFISLFCYEPSALEALIDQLTASPTPSCLLVTHGRAAYAVKALLEHKKRLQPAYLLPEQLLILYIPQLSQLDFDHLLWSCDLNFVRGEDSLVRAIWAAKPFIWQIYPQDDGAHHAKLNAFLKMMDAPASLKQAHRAWNASNEEHPEPLKRPELPALLTASNLQLWSQSAQNLSKKLQLQDDLATHLIAFTTLCREKQLKS